MVPDENESRSSVLNAIADPILITDKDFRILFANTAALALCDLGRDQVIGRKCRDLSPRCPLPCALSENCPHQEVFATNRSLQVKHVHRGADGNEKTFSITASPLTNADGTVVRMIEVLRDITEAENTAKALQRSEALVAKIRMLEEQLQHAQKMEAIGTLAGGIAHDFNNILHAIIGYGSLIQMKLRPDDPALPHLKEILAAGERAAQLTRGLLAFSRKQMMDLRVVKVTDLITDFRKMVERIIGEDIEFRVIMAPGDLFIQADTGQIEQVLMNLAANARDAMPQGGMLTMETERLTMDSRFIAMHGFGQPGAYTSITVSDSGTGMDEGTRKRMFEPYFTTKEPGKGTGLGLSIAFGIVKQHNGFLACQSEPGKGTSFTIYLPLSAAASAWQGKEREAAAPARGGEAILIAEDDMAVRGYTRQLLHTFGYSVIEAVNGEDAVNKFRNDQDRIKLLLLDVVLPKKNGRDAYQAMRAMKPDIKTIFMSGYAKDLMEENGNFDKGLEFLQKPVSSKVLLSKIRSVLDG
jgi:two-component system cell cycle sensor histidine kinase/response regulator CckA